jgi:prepilin-type processing-associated H-X9-DG protein
MSCQNNLHQIGLALMNYEASHKKFPPGRLNPDWTINGVPRASYTNYNFVNQTPGSGHFTGFRSVHTFLLPYMEQDNIYKLINFSAPTAVRLTTAGVPTNTNYQAYANAAGLFICPSCPNTGRVISENNYRYNFGGSTPYAGAQRSTANNNVMATLNGLSCQGNGAFTNTVALRAGTFADGLSNTAFFSERTKGSGRDLSSIAPTNVDVITTPMRTDNMVAPDTLMNQCSTWTPVPSVHHFNSAGRWLDGSDFSNGWPFGFYSSTMYNHVAPPNWKGFDCGTFSSIPDAPGEHAIMSARSLHSGGVNVCFGDGSIRFFSETVNLRTWRALGTRDSQDQIDSEE